MSSRRCKVYASPLLTPMEFECAAELRFQESDVAARSDGSQRRHRKCSLIAEAKAKVFGVLQRSRAKRAGAKNHNVFGGPHG